MKRRQFLAKSAAAGVAAVTTCPAWAISKKEMPIGVQLYSIREVIGSDIQGRFDALKKMGYDGVEFAGYYNKSAEELRGMLDKAGLKCCGTHIGLDTLKGDNLKKTIEFNKILGNKYLIVSYMKLENKQQCLDSAKQLTDVAAQLKPEGMVTGYHAHGGDFKQIEGSTPWDIIFDNTGPEVSQQMDTGNCMGGGGDPVAYLKKYPGRSLTIHLKEHGGGIIGEGKVKWQEVLECCETVGKTEWFVVEEEAGGQKSMDTVKDALNNLKKLIG